MAQNVVDFSGDMSGPELLDTYLTPLQNNELTSNSGTSVPPYAQEGTVWLDKSSETSWKLKLYDGNVDNVLFTINKGISVTVSNAANAQTALKATGDKNGNDIAVTYAPLASPAFTGTPTAPTPEVGTNSTVLATTEFVNRAVNTPDSIIELYQTSGTINLETNKIYKMSINDITNFVLPAASAIDVTKHNQIKMLVYLTGQTDIDFGTTSYFNKVPPEVLISGYYDLYWDFDPFQNAWVAGAISKGVTPS